MVFSRIKRTFLKRSRVSSQIDPDEIFLDSSNLPEFDIHQFEGRIEKPIPRSTIIGFLSVTLVLMLVLVGKAWAVQVRDGEVYAARSEENRLRHEVIFAERGSIFDQNGVKLAWNVLPETDGEFSLRSYINQKGFAHVLGYVRYPAKDKFGVYYRTEFEGVEGIEKAYDVTLKGIQGLRIRETNALGETQSESTVRLAENGENLTLSIDSRIQAKMHEILSNLAGEVGFTGGAGGIMDLETGEMIAMTNYPEYSSNVMVEGRDRAAINAYNKDVRKPFLNRFISGLFTPGSVVKPFMSLAALSEDLIDPEKEILSTGSIFIPNPYNPDNRTLFMDNKAHGLVDMRRAIAVSSNVYFYVIGGGYEGQKGLGIERIKSHLSKFGFGSAETKPFFQGPAGLIPDPAWKKTAFPDDPWRIGDTYFTSIGQYSFQVTPLQMLKAAGSIATDGFLIEPSILSHASSSKSVRKTLLPYSKSEFDIVQEGMEEAVEYGTAQGLNVAYVDIAAKTGTAELGASKAYVNSWVMGYFPRENPRYAFTVIMEHGPKKNQLGGVFVMRNLLDWMSVNAPEYFE